MAVFLAFIMLFSKPPDSTEFDKNRLRMVDRQIVARGVKDEAVLKAMRTVPRERFVPANQRSRAYDDGPLSIGEAPGHAKQPQDTIRPNALEHGPGLGHPGSDLLATPGYPLRLVSLKQRPGNGGNVAMGRLDASITAEAGQRVGVEGGTRQVRIVGLPVARPADEIEPDAIETNVGE